MWRTRDRALERGVEPFGRTVELRENSAPASWPSRPSQGVNELDEGDVSSADRVKHCTRLRSDLKSARATIVNRRSPPSLRGVILVDLIARVG